MNWETHTIANPVPFEFWEREVLVDGGDDGSWSIETGEGQVLPAVGPGGKPEKPVVLSYSLKPIATDMCRLLDLTAARRTNSQLDAFLFWSRAPFAVRAADGSVILYDARFYDPRARDRFSVALPDVKCEELPAP
jgi:inner membrane protein